MALLLLLREYLGKRGGERGKERGREKEREREIEREESCTDMESHDYASHVTLPARKLSHTTQSCVYCH